MGYYRSGFDIIGMDISPQRHYPFEFIQDDALLLDAGFLKSFDAIHASPPCQAWTNAQKLRGNAHPRNIIRPLRRQLMLSTKPFVIENVVGSPLRNPILLCGVMFGLGTYRHRLFESNVNLNCRPHYKHNAPLVKMGRPSSPNQMIHVVGNFSNVEHGRAAMGISWMTGKELSEAIPPAYTEHLGRQIMRKLF